MRKILVMLVCVCSLELPAWACDEEIMKMGAFVAAATAESINMQGLQPSIEFEPMNSHDVYRIVFTYSGRRSVWRVEIDEDFCRVRSVKQF